MIHFSGVGGLIDQPLLEQLKSIDRIWKVPIFYSFYCETDLDCMLREGLDTLKLCEFSCFEYQLSAVCVLGTHMLSSM